MRTAMEQMIHIYQEATAAVSDPKGMNPKEFLRVEKLREEAIYEIALLLEVAKPNKRKRLSNEQWNTCIDYIKTRNQETEAA